MRCLIRILLWNIFIFFAGCEEDDPTLACFAECDSMNRGYYCSSDIKLYQSSDNESYQIKGYIQHMYDELSMIALDDACYPQQLLNSTLSNSLIILDDSIQTHGPWGESFISGNVESAQITSKKAKVCKIFKYINENVNHTRQIQELACSDLVNSLSFITINIFGLVITLFVIN